MREPTNTEIYFDPNERHHEIQVCEALDVYGGLLLKWAIDTPADWKLMDYVLDQYGMPPGIMPMKKSEGAHIDEQLRYCYTEPETGESDPPMDPIFKIVRDEQTMLIYLYSIVAFFEEREMPNVVRLD